jgi:hypothetical protein
MTLSIRSIQPQKTRCNSEAQMAFRMSDTAQKGPFHRENLSNQLAFDLPEWMEV